MQGGGGRGRRGEGVQWIMLIEERKLYRWGKNPKLEKNAHLDLFEEVYHNEGQLYIIKTLYLLPRNLFRKLQLINRKIFV